MTYVYKHHYTACESKVESNQNNSNSKGLYTFLHQAEFQNKISFESSLVEVTNRVWPVDQ